MTLWSLAPIMLTAAAEPDTVTVRGTGAEIEVAAPAWTIGDQLADPEVLTRYGGIVVTLVLAVVIYLGLRRALNAVLVRNPQFQFLAQRLLRWFYIPMVILVVLQQLGINIGSLWTVVSATMAMVAIGFVAVWSVLSNVSSTFMIFSTRLFKVGDEVELLEPTAKEGLRGRVVDLNLLCTSIEQEPADGKGRIVTKIPNNVFFQKALRIRYDGAELPAEVPADAEEADAKAGGA